jgi:hypothetical protein
VCVDWLAPNRWQFAPAYAFIYACTGSTKIENQDFGQMTSSGVKGGFQ